MQACARALAGLPALSHLRQQPRRAARGCLPRPGCSRSCETTAPRALASLPGQLRTARGLAATAASRGWHKAPQTAPRLRGCRWGRAGLRTSQPWLRWVAAWTGQPPCSTVCGFVAHQSTGCLPPQLLQLNYNERKEIRKKSLFGK